MIEMGNCAYRSILTLFLSFFGLIATYGNNTAERETLPTDENALSLWLITRTGWVLCDRAAEYSKKIENPFESIAVQPFTCNSALTSSQENIPKKSNRPSFRQLPLPGLRHITQLLSLQGFSDKNDPKVDYPRKSYVSCLLGALFETELSLCPMNPDRRRCAAQKKAVDEDLILSKGVPISYKGGILNEGQSRSMQYSNW